MDGVISNRERNPAKVWLREYMNEKARMESLMREIDDLAEIAEKATSRLTATRLSGTGCHGGFEDTVLRKTDSEAELQVLINHINECLLARVAVIQRVPDDRQRRVLQLRYLEGKSWKQIADGMHYCMRAIYTIHGDALLCVNQIMQECSKIQ